MRWALAAVVFVGIMAGAGWYVYNEALRGGAHVEVPDVTLRPITEASLALAERGLEVGKQKMVADDRVPKYYVLTQRPEPGEIVRTGRRVFVTISAGSQSLTPPNFVDKMLSQVIEDIRRTPFALGTVARIPDASPRDTVLAQDPAPARSVPSGMRISVLVSDGQPKRTSIMPDILGMTIPEMTAALEPIGVKLVKQTTTAGQRYDVVLDQQPPPGALVQEGDRVIYTVNPSGQMELPDARQEVRVSYTIPNSWFEREVRIDGIDRYGVRTTLFPQENHFVNGEPPKFGSGNTIILPPVTFIDKMTVEIYLDGQLAETRAYEGDKETIITP